VESCEESGRAGKIWRIREREGGRGRGESKVSLSWASGIVLNYHTSTKQSAVLSDDIIPTMNTLLEKITLAYCGGFCVTALH